MSRPVVDYLTALAICLGAAVGYRLAVVPWVDPDSPAVVQVSDSPVATVKLDLSTVFPEGSWQLETPETLQATWGVLLYQEWIQEAEDRLRVKPVSVVLRDENGSRSGPIILDAPEGAVIEFAEPLNMLASGKPAIEGGQLVGDVHIYNLPPEGAPASEVASDGSVDQAFDLRTRHVRIDSRQIRSAEQVMLSIGGARIAGRDLTIHMAGGAAIPTNVDSPLSMLDSLELIYLDEMTIPLPDGPLWQPLTDIDSKSAPGRREPVASTTIPDAPTSREPVARTDLSAAPSDRAELRVHCDGRVVFDFTQFVLRMTEGVRIEHHWSRNDSDWFRCRELELHLVDPFVPRVAETESSASDIGAVLQRVTARGEPLEAYVPSLASHIKSGSVTVDFIEGRLKMVGHRGPVELKHREYRFQVPELSYQMDPARPTELGTFDSRGPGEVAISNPEIPVRKLAWSRALQLLERPDGRYLWVDGTVRGTMRDGGAAGADDILLMFQIPEATTEGDEDAQAEHSPADLLAAIQPEKLRARGNVFLDASALEAKTDELIVLFEQLPPGTEQPTPGLAGPALRPATGPRPKFWVSSPEADADGRHPPMAAPRPSLSGAMLSAKIWMRDREMIAQDVSVVKDVRLEHELQTEAGPVPLVYTGDSLRLVTGIGQEQIQIAGRPARIALADDGYFEGPLVIVDGPKNHVSIRDSGVFQVPSAMMPRTEPAALRWVAPPRCEFRGELTFDGQMVEIGPEVRLSGRMTSGDSAEVWDIAATAPRLQLALDRSIQVTTPTEGREAAVERVSLVGDQQRVVLYASQFDTAGTCLGRHLLNVPRLDLSVPRGQLTGQGAGWYRSWTPIAADSPMRSIAPPGSLLASHLIFNGGIEGELDRQTLAFYRGVRLGMSAVPNWTTEIDAATMTQLALNQGTVDCDRLVIGRSPTVSGDASRMPVEIQAMGGMAFRVLTDRGLFDGTATRAAYDGGNDLFVFEGSPNRDAVIRNTSPTGQVPLELHLPIVHVRPGTWEIDGRFRGATISQLP